MTKKIDLIDVMYAVHKGELKIIVHNGFFMMEDMKSGERVRLNEAYVMCKDCKHYVWNPFGDGCWVCTKLGRHGLKAKDFCSYGERRTDAETT